MARYSICQYSVRTAVCRSKLITLQREVSTSSTWDGGSVEPLVHSQHGAIVKVLESLIKSHMFFIRT